MRLGNMACVITGVVQKTLSPEMANKGIVFPVHIEVGSGKKSLCRYVNLFLHRTEHGIMVGAHRPTRTQMVLNPKSLSDWELLTHPGHHWIEDGVYSFLVETYIQLAKKFSPGPKHASVPVEMRFTRAPFVMELKRAVHLEKEKRIRLQFPARALLAA